MFDNSLFTKVLSPIFRDSNHFFFFYDFMIFTLIYLFSIRNFFDFFIRNAFPFRYFPDIFYENPFNGFHDFNDSHYYFFFALCITNCIFIFIRNMFSMETQTFFFSFERKYLYSINSYF